MKPPYEITFEERESYLYARVEASQLTGQIIYDFLTDILMEARRCRRRRILLERDIRVPPPEGEAQRAWNYFLEVVQGQRIAIYNPHPEITDSLRQRLTLLEKSPSHVRLFDQMPAAHEWVACGPVPDYNANKPRFLDRERHGGTNL